MKTKQIVQELEEAVRRLGLQVRFERGHFRGGYCKVDEAEYVVLNRRHPPEMHLAVLAESLRNLPVDTIFLRPATREALEAVWRRRNAIELTIDDDA